MVSKNLVDIQMMGLLRQKFFQQELMNLDLKQVHLGVNLSLLIIYNL